MLNLAPKIVSPLLDLRSRSEIYLFAGPCGHHRHRHRCRPPLMSAACTSYLSLQSQSGRTGFTQHTAALPQICALMGLTTFRTCHVSQVSKFSRQLGASGYYLRKWLFAPNASHVGPFPCRPVMSAPRLSTRPVTTGGGGGSAPPGQIWAPPLGCLSLLP